MGNIFNKNLKYIKLVNIRRDPLQPRKYFDPQALEELSLSIKKCGVINPISVKKVDNIYQIIAGERRFRAANLAGLTEIPCIILSNDDEKCAIVALVENIQRCNLNFIEEAYAYKKFIDDFNFTQDDLANKVGKSQSSIANKLRILKLESSLLDKIKENNLTERHARALLKLPEDNRISALEHIIKTQLNVAKTDDYIEKLLVPKKKSGQKFIKVVKDVRLFINTINKSVKIMQQAGVNASVNSEQSNGFLTYTIMIPTPSK